LLFDNTEIDKIINIVDVKKSDDNNITLKAKKSNRNAKKCFNLNILIVF
tara:strand:+ start:1914 stop:2060 length:147 start_codon:yes stop_codon:yes gene_type:complete